MSTQRLITRRQIIGAALAGAAGVAAGTILQGSERQTGQGPDAAIADPRIRGPFPILSTPFTASGAVDFDVLAHQARFVDWGGCPGMIWPQSGDSVDLLTTDEKLQGMEVLATAARGLRTALCLGVQGQDTAEMLVFARHAERLAPAAIISRPPDTGRTDDGLASLRSRQHHPRIGHLFRVEADRGGHRRDRRSIPGVEAVPEAGLAQLC